MLGITAVVMVCVALIHGLRRYEAIDMWRWFILSHG